MRKMLTILLLAACLGCGFAQAEAASSAAAAGTQSVHVANATDFSLLGVTFPDAPTAKIPAMKEPLDPQNGKGVIMAKAPSRMRMDMGMVRFVFPVASYTLGKEMTLALTEQGVPQVEMNTGQIDVSVWGVLVNLRAADAGDEAVFDYNQFFYPADATDACDVLGVERAYLAKGHEAPMRFGDIPAKGIVRADDKGALVLELRMPLTADLLGKLHAALNAAALWPKDATVKGTDADTQWESTGVAEADTQFFTELAELLAKGKGTATLTATYMGETRDPKARRGVLELDFAKKTLVATFE